MNFMLFRSTIIYLAMYLWQHGEWPRMSWQDTRLTKLLVEMNVLRGQLFGRFVMLVIKARNDSILETLTQEIVRSSEIEGDDHYIEGVVQLMLDATQNHTQKLAGERLFGWRAALFPTYHGGAYKITVAERWKGDQPMQVVSGAFGKKKVPFEAPPSRRMPTMMHDFLKWVDKDSLMNDSLVKADITHIWFVTIHPFDDEMVGYVVQLLKCYRQGRTRRRRGSTVFQM